VSQLLRARKLLGKNVGELIVPRQVSFVQPVVCHHTGKLWTF
jgi:hypothetical protein